MFELGIEGGTVIRPAGRSRSHLYIEDGRIAAVTAERQRARATVDASGLLLLPGMVDTHVHLMDPADPSREDFPTGTAAAARAGVTTIIEHTHAAPLVDSTGLDDKIAYLKDRSRVDYGLAGHAWPTRLDEVESLWKGGVSFLKVFTCTTHGLPGFDAGHLLELFRRVAGIGGICLVHCEDETITQEAARRLRSAGREDVGIIPSWRNREAELVAIAVTALLAERTGARVVVAHASNPEALAIVDRARSAGASIQAECCPQYLALLEQEVLEFGALRKFTPPARARTSDDIDAMWAALREGSIHHISTDHAPATLEQKSKGSIWDVHFGLPGIDTTLPFFLDACRKGRLGYERLVEVYAEVPARTYGFFPKKGSLQVGADADVILADPEASWRVEDEDILSKAGWSPYSGRTLVGRTVQTYLRGCLIADEGRVLAEPGVGEFLAGSRARG